MVYEVTHFTRVPWNELNIILRGAKFKKEKDGADRLNIK